MQKNKESKIIVLYDGSCPLCSKEIKLYQSSDANFKFNWQDIEKSQDILLKYELDYIDVKKIFHVIDKNNEVKKGVDGFLVIWKELKYWKILYYLVSFPILRQVAQFAYKYFAIWRFKRICK